MMEYFRSRDLGDGELESGWLKINDMGYYLNDCETENAETQVWLDFTHDCKYIITDEYNRLTAKNDKVEKLVRYMINNPDKSL